VIPTSNQDGRQARNRKRGDEIIPLEMHFFGMNKSFKNHHIV
jgi:hypothetical protein